LAGFGTRGIGAINSDDSAGAYVWDAAADGREPRVLGGHVDHGVTALSFSPDGRRLATLSGNDIKVWDPASGQELLTLAYKTLPGTSTFAAAAVRFSADGSRLSVFDRSARRTYDAAPLPPALEAPDVADRLAPSATPAEVAAQLDRLVLSPELKAGAMALARARPAPKPRGRQGGAGGPEMTIEPSSMPGMDELPLEPRAAFLQPPASPYVVVFGPDRPVEEYRRVWATAETVRTRVPDNSAAWFRAGAALYRLGRYEEARAALTRFRELEAEADPAQVHPAATAFLAMTHHHLGQPDKSKEELARLRRELAAEPFASGLAGMAPAMRAFYAEPAALIEGTK
jgi:tetratricopeptide (TPR) repeat protein